MRRQQDVATSAVNLNQYAYNRQIGAFKPKFVGISEDYYPLTKIEIFKYTLFVVGIIIGVMGIMIGFLIWIKQSNLNNYIIVWSIVTLCFVLSMIILFYIGGKGRIREQKQLIVHAHDRFEELKGKKKINTEQI